MTLTKRGKDWNEGYKQGALEELNGLLEYWNNTGCCQSNFLKKIEKRIEELESVKGGLK